jgi:hypothetical protein
MMTCKEASRLVSESHDRPLRLGERFGLRLHLLICAACARFERHLRFLRRAAEHDTDTERAPSTVRLSSTARRRIAEALRHRR